MTVISTFYKDLNFNLVADPEADPAPKHFTVFLNGIESVVTATEGEDQLQVWLKVLGHLQWRRKQAKQAGSRVSPNALITVYAGQLDAQSLNNARHRHMREYVVDGLLSLCADPKACGTAKIKAYKLLIKIQPLAEAS